MGIAAPTATSPDTRRGRQEAGRRARQGGRRGQDRAGTCLYLISENFSPFTRVIRGNRGRAEYQLPRHIGCARSRALSAIRTWTKSIACQLDRANACPTACAACLAPRQHLPPQHHAPSFRLSRTANSDINARYRQLSLGAATARLRAACGATVLHLPALRASISGAASALLRF